MPIPLKGDRSVRDMGYPELHATDIEVAEYEYHVPPASVQTVGSTIRATATGWVAASISEIVYEDFTSLVNGIETVFTTTDIFVAGSVKVYLNGLRQSPIHYVEDVPNKTVTLAFTPLVGDELLIEYGIIG